MPWLAAPSPWRPPLNLSSTKPQHYRERASSQGDHMTASAAARATRPWPGSSGLVLHRLDQLPARPRRREIVAGLIAAGELVTLSGEPGSGKSAIAARLAVCIATGEPFFGREVSTGAVVYVAAERKDEVTRRLLALSPGSAPIYLAAGRPNLGARGDADDLVRLIGAACDQESERPSLVIVDTLARCMPALDENSSRDVGAVMDNLAVISEALPTAAIIVIHHRTKANGGLRGSSAILGAIDLDLRVHGGASNRRITVEKANAIETGQSLPFRLVPLEVDIGGVRSTAIAAVAADAPRAGCAQAHDRRLPPDAATALATLEGIAGGHVVSFSNWRDATMVAFGDRKPGAKRQAWQKVHRLLEETGHIAVSGESVSISKPSAQRQHHVSADGAESSAEPSARAPLIRGR